MPDSEMKKDYYDILGVQRNASGEEIKAAYRVLAHRFHPDKSDDDKQFLKIVEAYRVLSDEKNKAKYDQKSKNIEPGDEQDSADQKVVTAKNEAGNTEENGLENNYSRDEGLSPIAIVVLVIIGIAILVGSISAVTNSNSQNSPATTNPANNAISAATTTASNIKTSLPVITPQHNTQTISQGSQSAPATTNPNITTSFISQIEPAIVLVVCFPPDYSTSGNLDYGSGVSVDYAGTTYIETNYHVYNAENTGGGSPTCFAYYPGPAPDFSISSQSGGYQLTFYRYNYDPATSEDVADFTLGAVAPSSTALTSIPVINNTPLTGIGLGCSDVNSGDGVTIFGYPASGNYLDLSETVTQGTISGQNPGPIYKFDGAIDHGNSGGLAVLDKSSCDLGIPTLGVSGLTAGTGYIQSISLARTRVTLTNNQICQNQYGINSVYSGSNNNQGGLICSCVSGYAWNTGNTACVELPKETGYQVCSEAYPNVTWDGTYTSDGKYHCVCDSGYYSYNGECVSGYTYCTDTEGYGANFNGSSCTCDAGYVYSGGQCVSGYTFCSEYGGYADTYNSLTGKCECMVGYSWNGSSCIYSPYYYP